jgi:hypothetical protein
MIQYLSRRGPPNLCQMIPDSALFFKWLAPPGAMRRISLDKIAARCGSTEIQGGPAFSGQLAPTPRRYGRGARRIRCPGSDHCDPPIE